MAIEVVGVSSAYTLGHANIPLDTTIQLPPGLQLDDVVHISLYLPRAEFFRYNDDGSRIRPWGVATGKNWHPYLGTPEGWTLVANSWYRYGQEFTDRTALFRRFITGTEDPEVTFHIPWSANIFVPEEDPEARVSVAAIAVAHRGVDLNRVYAVPPTVGAGRFQTNTPTNSALVQLRHRRLLDRDNSSGLEVGDQLPPLPNPVIPTTVPNPSEWEVLLDMRPPAFETVDHYDLSNVIQGHMLVAQRAAVLHADNYTPGQVTLGPDDDLGSYQRKAWYFALMNPLTPGFAVDPPEAPGQPGVTTSGWILPEWEGRQHRIKNPLRCTVWTEGETPSGPGLVPDALGQLEPIGLDAAFDALGNCQTAVATFPADPGLTPWQQVLKFQVVTDDTEDPEEAAVWWTGVVQNVSSDGAGLFTVDLLGLWSLLNEARIQVDNNDEVTKPESPLIKRALMLGGGDPTAVVIENEADKQRTWGEYFSDTFRISPDAAWGIGPDQTFSMGLPQNAGFLTFDSEEPFVTEVEPGEFILPPFVTDWWAEETSGGPVHSGELIPPPGLLTPRRLVQSRLGDLGNLITPAEASLPTFAGPSHTLRIAGMAIPPLRADGLPAGSQMIAGARVVITVGDESSMPTITTTLTTVALPFG